jgi:hypothetical protein
MSFRGQTISPTIARHRAGLGLILAAMLWCCIWAAAAEQPAPSEPASAAASQAAPSEPAAAPASQPDGHPGLFGAIGHWIDRSIDRVSASFGGKSEAGETRKNAMIGLLPKTKIVSGFALCETAPNGAPDCRGAIENLCRTKGLTAGRSLDVQAVEKCPARAWISGAQASKGECRTESYVRRAFCR